MTGKCSNYIYFDIVNFFYISLINTNEKKREIYFDNHHIKWDSLYYLSIRRCVYVRKVLLCIIYFLFQKFSSVIWYWDSRNVAHFYVFPLGFLPNLSFVSISCHTRNNINLASIKVLILRLRFGNFV